MDQSAKNASKPVSVVTVVTTIIPKDHEKKEIAKKDEYTSRKGYVFMLTVEHTIIKMSIKG